MKTKYEETAIYQETFHFYDRIEVVCLCFFGRSIWNFYSFFSYFWLQYFSFFPVYIIKPTWPYKKSYLNLKCKPYIPFMKSRMSISSTSVSPTSDLEDLGNMVPIKTNSWILDLTMNEMIPPTLRFLFSSKHLMTQTGSFLLFRKCVFSLYHSFLYDFSRMCLQIAFGFWQSILYEQLWSHTSLLPSWYWSEVEVRLHMMNAPATNWYSTFLDLPNLRLPFTSIQISFSYLTLLG